MMTQDTQQFVIRAGFVGALTCMLASLIALALIAIVHDGTLASQMVDLFTNIVQQGLYVVGGLVGIHTLVGGMFWRKLPPAPPAPSGEPVAGS